MGSGLIPLNKELQQDNRTVCCGHTAVRISLLLHAAAPAPAPAADPAPPPAPLPAPSQTPCPAPHWPEKE